mmetsp:Transcript_61206/g.99026  ORF Transcript_61206/g.99026 Transcript_61206/m.99026 type:complete len:144 (+) Transcript_61206:85-516(+)
MQYMHSNSKNLKVSGRAASGGTLPPEPDTRHSGYLCVRRTFPPYTNGCANIENTSLEKVRRQGGQQKIHVGIFFREKILVRTPFKMNFGPPPKKRKNLDALKQKVKIISAYPERKGVNFKAPFLCTSAKSHEQVVKSKNRMVS